MVAHRRRYFVFASIGLALCLALVVWRTVEAGAHPAPPFDGWVWLLFLAFGVATRSMSFELAGITLSLDTAVFVSAALCLGAVPAAWLVLNAMAGYDLAVLAWRVARGEGPEPAEVPWRVLRSLYGGAAAAAALLLAAWLWHVDPAGMGEPAPGEWRLLVRVLAVLATWLPLQYALVGASLVAGGVEPGVLARKVLMPGLMAEFALAPLTAAMVLVYSPRWPLPFVLVGLSAMFFVYAIRRLSQTSASLRARVRELEVAREFAQRIGMCLDVDHLMDQIAEALLELYDSADQVVLGGLDGERRSTRHYARGIRRPQEPPPAARRVVDVVLADGPSGAPGAVFDGPCESETGLRWVGTGLVGADGVRGALVVRVSSADARDPQRRRVLAHLAHQASVAWQNLVLYEMATVDALTGLYLRRVFEQRIAEEVARADRTGEPLSLIVFDVDDFKRVNDEHLHTTGDLVLRTLGAIVRRCTRAMDVAARVGGDEFAVLLPGASYEQAMHVAQRLGEEVRAAHIEAPSSGAIVRVTISAGVATWARGEDDVDAFVQRADASLYCAKHQCGKNAVAAV